MVDVLLQVEINGFLSFKNTEYNLETIGKFNCFGDKFAELKQGREFVISQFRSFQKKKMIFRYVDLFFIFLGGGKSKERIDTSAFRFSPRRA